MMNYRLLVIDDHLLFLDALCHLLKDAGFSAIDKASSLAQAYELLSRNTYHFAVIDLHLAHSTAFEFLTHLRSKRILLPTAIVSSSQNTSEIAKSIELGAVGFLSKECKGEDFVNALKSMISGDLVLPEYFWNEWDMYPTKKDYHVDSLSKVNLSARKVEVLTLVNLGLTNLEIAERLEIGETTVKYHLSDLFKLFKVKNRMSLMKEAKNLGII